MQTQQVFEAGAIGRDRCRISHLGGQVAPPVPGAPLGSPVKLIKEKKFGRVNQLGGDIAGPPQRRGARQWERVRVFGRGGGG